ncbi:MAG TPA: protein kinase, partial [Ktedonobacteraceae bacterium]|nr:protein kinase [Ktedonobacteraceae bacterium]
MSSGVPSNPQRIGKYELRERLGSGGMAEVWKAYDPQLERFVAIKILHPDLQTDPEFLTRFVREARVSASLHHPNIIQIHDFQTIQSADASSPMAYMVMDYIEGPTLARYIRSTSCVGKFPTADEIVQLFASISRAVDYAHQHNMIHRDIKPANILLDQRNRMQNPMGEPILTDFGIARIIGISSGTASGGWLGTPIYIAPEQALGQPGTERSDIYSLGVILYEICTGVQPFRGENISSLMMQHIHTAPTAPSLINPNIPPALSMVILRCLNKDPMNRFSSAAALAAALGEALNVQLPADISQHWMLAEEMSQPTMLSPLRPGTPISITPLLPPSSLPGTVQLAQSGSQMVSPLPAQVGTKPINPTTPFPGSFTPTSSATGQQAALLSPPFVNAPPLQTPVFAQPDPPVKKQRRGM